MLGFNYNKSGDYYYTSEYSIQRLGGFGNFYDHMGSVAGMNLDTDYTTFSHNGKEYRFQLWKGSYGYGNSYGAEIGLYTRNANNLWNGAADALGEWYPCASESDQMRMINKIFDANSNELLMTNDTADYAKNGTHYWNLAIRTEAGYKKEGLYTRGELYIEDKGLRDKLAKEIAKMAGVGAANVQIVGNRVKYQWRK
ncbi:MAG: DUF4474 domain-containing protein [Streptococcaceae bacterium]|jgi:hypothetical protein|nr:DUF4474 domain-containing protein [Streptococcaceae bacterium]